VNCVNRITIQILTSDSELAHIDFYQRILGLGLAQETATCVEYIEDNKGHVGEKTPTRKCQAGFKLFVDNSARSDAPGIFFKHVNHYLGYSYIFGAKT